MPNSPHLPHQHNSKSTLFLKVSLTEQPCRRICGGRSRPQTTVQHRGFGTQALCRLVASSGKKMTYSRVESMFPPPKQILPRLYIFYTIYSGATLQHRSLPGGNAIISEIDWIICAPQSWLRFVCQSVYISRRAPRASDPQADLLLGLLISLER